MRTMTTRDTDLTRGKLLDAAFCEIHRQGFQAASIANILRDTGLTKGALYHHFPTKQDLGLAVVDEVVAARFEERMFRPLRESRTPVATLLAIIEERLGVDKDSVVLGCPLNNLIQEMSPLDAAFKERLSGIVAAWGQTVEDALKRGQAAGEVRADVDCRAACLFIISAWEGCVSVAKSMQSPAGFAMCMRQLQNYIRSLAPA